MAKVFSILHRAAALLVAVCLLVGMALPVYAAGDESLFFGADSETIPDEASTTVAENSQNTTTAGLESVSPKVDTVSETDGTSPAEDGSTPPSDAQDQEETVLPGDAPNTDEEPTTEDAPNTDEEPTAEEETLMLADDFSVNDGAGEPATIADTGETSQGFIPATTTIYFVDDGTYDTKYSGQNCTIHFFAQNICSGNNNTHVDKVMTFTGRTDNNHKIFSVTLNSADYPEGGFYRLAFQYYHYVDNNNKWAEEIYAFGGMSDETNKDHRIAIDLLAGKKFVRTGSESDDKSNHYNYNSPYNATQWKRVEYCYKGMPLYFKNESGADLTNVTAVFYKKGTDGAVEPTVSLPIGTVGANQFYAQKILIPNNDSPFVKFTWGDGNESALYNFSTDNYDSVEKFDLTTTNCFVYNDSESSWQRADSDLLTGGKIIYFDATLSSYGYEGEHLQQQPMPGDSKTMYCFLTDSDGNVTPKEMTKESADPATPDRQLYSCQIPLDDGKTYTAVQFSAVESTTATAQDNKTKPYSTADIPPTLTNPCFFADDGDPSAYEPNGTPVFRDGYWGEKNSRRDAESGKGSTVVDIASGTFTQQAGTKYITSTLYDYYTDYELNGFNRDSAPSIDGSSQRSFVTFEQFDRALSKAYENANVKYPIYTGHFEPTSGALFKDVAGDMNLYGWGDPNGSPDQKALYNTFMAVNNSTYDDKGNNIQNDYSRTFQGLVEDHTSNGLPLLRAADSSKTALVDPHFNEDFLLGNNRFNTVLGKVYKDVSFPFTKGAVFYDDKKPDDSDNAKEQNAKYWYYDSSKASLYLKQDKTNGKYYLESPINSGKPTTDDKSKNIYPSNGATHGFFPFNQTVSTGGASQYNYGFGAKLQFDFTLTEDGNVVVGKGKDGKDIKVPIKFFFSGDDDVWVYIDGKLVLDVGGAHGKASGLLEFGAGSTVTPYVSSNKNTDTSDTMVYQTPASKTVHFNGTPITFTKTIDNAIQLDKRTTHTLTMFYMERGMWDSNMAVAFNFPDNNELQVEKHVDLTNVDPAFKSFFKGQNLFTFTLQNLATHYGPKTIDDKTPKPVKVGSDFDARSSDTDRTTMEKGKAPSDTDSQTYKDQTVMWYAQGYDKGSQYRELRYGTMTLKPALNISTTPDYLSFDVYAKGNPGDGVLSTNYLYLTLVDGSGKKMGCDVNDKKSYLNTMLSGSVVMENDKWVTVKLQLNKMPKDSGFDLKNIQKILIGDDYERTVYFRNFVFTAKPVVNTTVGFSVEQKDIPDYGSVENSKLMPASGAIFTSSVAINGTQAVDTDGTFDLQNDETVTFTDQFRRGSYISLQEAENPNLYDTRWEVYENGTLVKTANTSTSVDLASPLPLQGKDTKPNDGRTEKTDSATVGYNGIKPDANTLVFRSYAAPEEEFPKLKVRFINTVKVGTLVIEKKQANDGSNLAGKSYEFTVTFSNVGGIGLGGATGVTMTNTLKVDERWEITGIPIGTRFQVVETPAADSSLQRVECTDTNAQYDVVDNGVRGTVTSDMTTVTATFTNTAHQLMDIEVEKQWKDAKGNLLTDNQSDTVWVKLQRRHAGKNETWQDVPSKDSVELKYNYLTGKWTDTFKRLDKTDVNSAGTPDYEYRVLESATGTKDWYGGTDGDVIVISGKRYKVLNATPVTGDSSVKTLTLTNQLQDAKYKLVITKQDAQDDGIKLDGVEFKLEKLNAVPSETPKTGVTGSDGAKTGKLTFADLSPGKYRLTETKTAEGYTLLSEAIEFELTADGKCQRSNGESITVTPDTTSGVYNIALTIYNRKGFTLPHTGADAPSLWLLLGLPALVAVLLVLVFRYKKRGRRS